MHAILNTCGEMVRKGARFEDGAQVSDVLEGYKVRFRRVAAKESYTAYLGCGCNHDGGTAFPVLQCLWPDKNRKFPGEDGAAAFLATDQPLPG